MSLIFLDVQSYIYRLRLVIIERLYISNQMRDRSFFESITFSDIRMFSRFATCIRIESCIVRFNSRDARGTKWNGHEFSTWLTARLIAKRCWLSHAHYIDRRIGCACVHHDPLCCVYIEKQYTVVSSRTRTIDISQNKRLGSCVYLIRK